MKQAQIINLKASRLKKQLSGDELNDLQLSENQETLALATDNQEVLVVGYSSLEMLHRFTKHENVRQFKILRFVSVLLFRPFRLFLNVSPALSFVFSGAFDFNIIHWDFQKGERLRTRRIEKTLLKHNAIPGISELPYNPPYTYEMKAQTLSDQHLLLVGLGNGYLLILEQKSLQFYKYFALHGLPLTHLLFATDWKEQKSDETQETKIEENFQVLSICSKGEAKWLTVRKDWESIVKEELLQFPFKIGAACLGSSEGRMRMWGGSPDENCLYEFQIK